MENKIVLSLPNGVKIECSDEDVAVRMVSKMSGGIPRQDKEDASYGAYKGRKPERKSDEKSNNRKVTPEQIAFVLDNKHLKISELARASIFNGRSYRRARVQVELILGKHASPAYLRKLMDERKSDGGEK